MAREYLEQSDIDFIKEYVIGVYDIDATKGEVYSYRTGKSMGHLGKHSDYLYASITFVKKKVRIIPIRWIIAVYALNTQVGDKIVHKNDNRIDNRVDNLKIIKRFEYNVLGDVTEVKIHDSETLCLIDTKDIDLVKKYIWYIDEDGYIVTKWENEGVRMHRLLTNCPKNKDVDHKNRVRHDNRSCNLRICTSSENTFNKSIMNNNKSGVSGVFWDNNRNKWCGKLGKDGKYIFKRFKLKEDAIRYRLQLEKEHFKEFAPQKHLFEQYGI